MKKSLLVWAVVAILLAGCSSNRVIRIKAEDGIDLQEVIDKASTDNTKGFNQHYGKGNVVRNNIFVNGLEAQLEANRIEDHLSFTFSNNIVSYRTGTVCKSNWKEANSDVHGNLYWNENGAVSFNGLKFEDWQAKYGKDEGSVIADPMFGNVDEGGLLRRQSRSDGKNRLQTIRLDEGRSR